MRAGPSDLPDKPASEPSPAIEFPGRMLVLACNGRCPRFSCGAIVLRVRTHGTTSSESRRSGISPASLSARCSRPDCQQSDGIVGSRWHRRRGRSQQQRTAMGRSPKISICLVSENTWVNEDKPWTVLAMLPDREGKWRTRSSARNLAFIVAQPRTRSTGRIGPSDQLLKVLGV